jgi:hypothetical protein
MDLVDQHELARRIDGVRGGERVARHAVDAAARLVVRPVEVDVAVARELGVDGDAEQAALAVAADRRAERDRGRRDERPVRGDHAQQAGLRRDEDPAVWRE